MTGSYFKKIKDMEVEEKVIKMYKAKADKLERIQGQREREELRD